MYQKQILKNNIRLLTIPTQGVKSATALVLVRTGSRFEQKQTNGISHLLEHMAFKGTEKRPSTVTISSLLDSVGAEFNAYTGKEFTGYWVKLESSHLPLALDILSDILLHSLYLEEELEREKGVVIEEINMYEDTPMRNIGDVFEDLIFKGTSLGWRIAGTKESVRVVSRSDMVNYVKRQYTGDNIVVGISGAVEKTGNSRELVEEYFSPFAKGEENKYPEAKFSQTGPDFYLYPHKADQASFILGLRAYPYNHPDRYPLAVLNTVLGASMSSRLWIEVRERRGLAYFVRSGVEEYLDNGYLGIQAGVAIPRIDEAVKTILEQLDLIRSKPVQASELARAKENWKGKMVLTLEDTQNVASMYVHQELMEAKIDEPEEILKKIDAVTVDDIQRVAKDVIKNESLNLAVIGPYKKKEENKLQNLLKL